MCQPIVVGQNVSIRFYSRDSRSKMLKLHTSVVVVWYVAQIHNNY